MIVTRVLPALLLCVVVAACGEDGETSSGGETTTVSPSATPTRPSIDERCSSEELRAAAPTEVGFEASDGTELYAVELGDGPRGLVLLHTTSSTALCGWAPAMTWLADAGFHVLAMDSRCSGYSGCETGEGFDLDLLAATEELRSRGAETVIAVGGSRGGSVTLSAAARPDHDLDAVVDLSGGWPHAFYTGPSPSDDPAVLAKRIDVPVLGVAARDDLGMNLEEHRAVHQAIAAKDKEYVLLKEGGHAMMMLGLDEPSAFYRGEFMTFLEKHSR
ncbi:MAG: alpha/beta hydrolase family protein [Nocardioidaceae bacterium]